MVHFQSPYCWGTHSGCSPLHPVTGGIRSAQTTWLLSGDAFSVIKAERHPNMELQLFHLKKVGEGKNSYINKAGTLRYRDSQFFLVCVQQVIYRNHRL